MTHVGVRQHLGPDCPQRTGIETGGALSGASGGMAQIDGTHHNDTLNGGAGNDTIIGHQGHDVITGATLSGANLLVDGSFETAPVAAHTWTYFSEVGGWHSNTGVEVWGKDFIKTASDGNVTMELDFDNNFSKVWQDVKTSAGQEYALSLDAAVRPGTVVGTNAIEVFWNGNLVGRIEPGSTDWQHEHFTVVGSGGTDRLEFREDATQNDSLGGLIDNVKLFAEGKGNVLLGGTGNDTITAGNSNDLLVGNDGKAGNVDMNKMTINEDVTAHVTFDGSGAGYHNAVGMYTYDNAGKITGVQMVYTDVSGAGVAGGPANPDIAMKAGDRFGFFVAANAHNQGDNAAMFSDATGSFKMVDAVDGSGANVNAGHEMKLVFVAADGTMTDIKTQYGTSLFTTNTSDNGDGYQHSQVTVDPLTGKMSVKFEDLWNGGDQNFYDANFSMNIGATNAVQLAHEFATGHHAAQNDDMLMGGVGNDTLIGLSGEDTLNGGSGTNKLFGGSGNDKFVSSGGNDKINGGSGFDTLDLSNADHGVKLDLSKHTMVGFGTGTVKSIEAVIGTKFDDTFKGDKRANDLNGGDGNDVLRGYRGADTLTGGAGDDIFFWQKKDVIGGATKSLGVDTITDFGNGNDVLDIHKLFSGIKGDHAGLVSLVETKMGTELWADVKGHHVEVAMLEGVHNATVADLISAHALLV